jgi:hypothetical protein
MIETPADYRVLLLSKTLDLFELSSQVSKVLLFCAINSAPLPYPFSLLPSLLFLLLNLLLTTPSAKLWVELSVTNKIH